MPISLFSTRSMIEMLEIMPPANTFLKQRFFNNVRRFETEYVDIDIIKGKRRMAPFVSPIIGGKTIDRNGYKTDTYKPVLIAPDMITTAQDLLNRAPGENIYGAMSPDERASEQLGRDMVEMDNMISRREEWMCAQALFAGAITMTGEGVSETVNFNPSSSHVITLGSTALWSADTSDPLGDLRDARRNNVKDSGTAPDTVLMGSDAIDAFLNNSSVKEFMDMRRVDMGMIDPQTLPEGVTYYGYLKEIGCDIYGYDEWYLDDSGNEQPMVPTKKVLVGSSKARTDMLYGAVVDVVDGTFALERVPKSWTTPKPSARFVAIKSRPLPVPTQIDAFTVLTVLS